MQTTVRIVSVVELKMRKGSGQQGMTPATPRVVGSTGASRCPVYKVGSIPFVSSTWNMVNHNVPRNAWLREGNSKGELMRVVAEESGGSEGVPVMRAIAVEAQADIIACESRQTSGWSFVARRTRELRTRES